MYIHIYTPYTHTYTIYIYTHTHLTPHTYIPHTHILTYTHTHPTHTYTPYTCQKAGDEKIIFEPLEQDFSVSTLSTSGTRPFISTGGSVVALQGVEQPLISAR